MSAGFSLCRICGCRNGGTELTDGVYVWPDGLAHYVTEHDVRLPDVFVQHVLSYHPYSRTPINDSWWRSIEGPGE